MRIVFIEKSGDTKESNIKLDSLNELYKKCGFKSNNNFSKAHTWCVKNNYYSVFSKTSGRANQENKYELPPPIDNELYFGKMIAIKHSSKELKNKGEIQDLSKEEWESTYETLFGGFEDLGDEDSYSEEEHIPEHLKTKDGYMKDGFVVSDESDENDSDFELDDETAEEYEEDEETDNEEEYEESDEYVDNSNEESEEEVDEMSNDSESQDESQEDDENDEEEYYSDSELSLEEYDE